MANYLDANPDDAGMIEAHRQLGQFVPIAKSCTLFAFVDPHHLALEPISAPLPIKDYVVGLELLGFRFHLQKGQDGTPSLFRQEPDLPPSWDAHALRIAEAFGSGRMDEVRAFIIARDDAL